MRILQVMQDFTPEQGGVVKAVTELAEWLASKGATCVVLTLGQSDPPRHWARGDASDTGEWPQPGSVTVEHGLTGGKLSRLVGGADVVHIHQLFRPLIAGVALACKRMGTPYVLSPHGVLDEWPMSQRRVRKQAYWWFSGRLVVRNAAGVHFTADAEERQSRPWAPNGRTWRIPLILPPVPPRPDQGTDGNPFAEDGTGTNLLFFSRLDRKKGVDIFLSAVGIVRQRGEQVSAVVAGSGDEEYAEELRRLVRELDLDDVVHFAGFVPKERKRCFLEAADVFVLPTAQENFGYAALEALQCGTPVITTRGVDIWEELLASGAAGIVERDPVAVADVLIRWMRDRETLHQMGARGEQWVAEWLDGRSVSERYLSMYEAVALDGA